MASVVVVGAGCIGRGFLGQVLHDSGYEVVFIDIDLPLVEALNQRQAYTLRLVDQQSDETRVIDRVRAVSGYDLPEVAQAIAQCRFMTVSVGKAKLCEVAPYVLAGMKERMKRPEAGPLNILLCENLLHAADFFKNVLEPLFLPEDEKLLAQVGLVETTMCRTVPRPTAAMRAEDPSAIVAEPYCSLPVNTKAFLGEVPAIRYLDAQPPFAFHEEKKLFVQNMGHAVCAYLGALRGHGFLWQAAQDPVVAQVALGAMFSSCDAIAKAYRRDREELHAFARQLMRRFGSPLLADPIPRVGQDPLRKLAATDRMVGAVNRCKQEGVDYEQILKGIAAGMLFRHLPDSSVEKMAEQIGRQGPAGFAGEYCGLDSQEAERVARYYGQPQLLFEGPEGIEGAEGAEGSKG